MTEIHTPPPTEAPRAGRTVPAVLLTLLDFCAAGLRPRTPLARAIALALVVKLVVIISMKVFWFSGDARPHVDEAAMARLLGPSTHAPK